MLSLLRRFSSRPLTLPSTFLSKFDPYHNPFNELGQIAYMRTYSRLMPNGANETWLHTVKRVVEGVYYLLYTHCCANNIPFTSQQYMDEACQFFTKIYNCELLPSGRCLWALGSPIIETKGLNAALNNCAFVSTDAKNSKDLIRVFEFTMDALMLGNGVGFDTKGSQYKHAIHKPLGTIYKYVIPDSREGWVHSLVLLLESFFYKDKPTIHFDYSQIRKAGVPLKIFGGIASGPAPLQEMLETVRKSLTMSETINSTLIVDIMNIIGKCIVSGNIRRSAQIAIGEANDANFLQLKNYKINPHRQAFGWTSNNSIFVNVGDDYNKYVPNIRENGEPGLAWLENMRAYGRTIEPKNYKDNRAMGGNPCFEQTLESYELCCLGEVFLNKFTSLSNFYSSIKSAFTFAKYVSLGDTHWPESNEVIRRNRRVGCSLSGIANFLYEHSEDELIKLMDSGYKVVKDTDSALSRKLKVNESIKVTTIKPSGTISLLAGSSPGVHFSDSNYYLRRVRVSNRNLVEALKVKGYKMEEEHSRTGSEVVEIPMYYKGKTYKDISAFEQLRLVDLVQKYWADNQVSCTVRVKDNEWGGLARDIGAFDKHLKGISFIPYCPEKKIYDQAPYEEITREEYESRLSVVSKAGIALKDGCQSAPEASMFCDSDACDVCFKHMKK